jgi:hypothetical protein
MINFREVIVQHFSLMLTAEMGSLLNETHFLMGGSLVLHFWDNDSMQWWSIFVFSNWQME